MADEIEWVEMRHPKLGDDSTAPDGGVASVPRAAFTETYEPLGWVVVEPDQSPKARRSAATSTQEG